MAQIIRCDVCHEEVPPEKAFHSIIRYWNWEKGDTKEIAFDTCPSCFERFKVVLEDIPNKTRELGDKKWEDKW